MNQAAKQTATTPRKRLWEERRDLIRTAAYFRAERRGFQLGRELEDWLAAEAEIDASWRPSQAFWIEGVEELFDSVVSNPWLAPAFSPILSSVPQDILLGFAKKALDIKNYYAKAWSVVAPYLTAESLSELLSEARDPEVATLIVCSRPEMWEQGIDLIISPGRVARDTQHDWHRKEQLVRVANQLRAGQLPAFWKRMAGCSTWEKGQVLRTVIGRLPQEMLPEARAIAREVEEFDVRMEILKQIASRRPDAWRELLDGILTTKVYRDCLNYLRWNVSALPDELLETAANVLRAEENAAQRAELLEVLAERMPELWPEVLEARYRDLCEKGVGEMSREQWAAATIEEKALHVSTTVRLVDRPLLLGRMAAAYPKLWGPALDALQAASEAGAYWGFNGVPELLREKTPPDLAPRVLRILMNRNMSAGLEDDQTITALLDRTPEARLPEVLDAARSCARKEATVMVLARMAKLKDEELSLEATAAALGLPDYGAVRQRVLADLFEHPQPVFLRAALRVARGRSLEVNRAELFTLIAPHLPETWSEALAALELVGGSERFRCLDRSLKHLPQVLFPYALRLAKGVDELSRRAQLLAQIGAYGPPGLLPEVLYEVEQLPHYPRASALAKLAFHVPSQSFSQLDRLAPWIQSGHYVGLRTAMDKLKTYETVLPARLPRNLRVCLFNQLYQGWVSVEGRMSGLLSSTRLDPAGPAPSYWPFETAEWDLALECSAYTKPRLEKGTWFVLSLWIYQPAQREQVRETAKELNRASLAARSTGHRAAKGSRITLSLSPRHLVIQDGSQEAVKVFERSFVWQGDPANFDLIVQCPETYEGDELFETVNILVEGLKVGEAVIDMRFGNDKAESSKAVFRPVGSAFASYSHRDAPEVIARLQVIEKMVPGIRLFWDVESLHSGDKWQERLAEEILNKDVFYLFWSQNAVQSEWVDWEWHCAYNRKGIDYIDPLPLDQTKPPPELEPLQFADRWVRHLRYEKLERAAQASGGLQ